MYAHRFVDQQTVYPCDGTRMQLRLSWAEELVPKLLRQQAGDWGSSRGQGSPGTHSCMGCILRT